MQSLIEVSKQSNLVQVPYHIYSIYSKIVEASYELDESWLSSFPSDKQKVFQVSLCEVLHTIQSIDQQQDSNYTGSVHDIQMIQNILEANYSLANGTEDEDTDSDLDELVNATLNNGSGSKKTGPKINLMHTPQFIEGDENPEQLETELVT